jgi:uncharacterized BrkB/YihY/UPF0761 family membrane protein
MRAETLGESGIPAYGTAGIAVPSRLERMSAPQQSDLPARRIDSVLAVTGLSLLVLSVICFLAIIIATPAGAHFNTPFWHVVGILVYVAPILGFALLIFVVLSSFVRRSRANRGS